MAMSDGFKEAIWLKGLTNEIGFCKNVIVFADSQPAIDLASNPVHHDRTKHIEIRYHFIRDILERNVLKLEKIPSEFNPADMGTKSLPAEKLVSCLRIMHFDFG